MDYVHCPNCREKTVPVGGVACDLCGWKKKGSQTAESDGREAAEVSKAEKIQPETEPAVHQDGGQVKKPKACTHEDGCAEDVFCKGLCKRHYWQLAEKRRKAKANKARTEKHKDKPAHENVCAKLDSPIIEPDAVRATEAKPQSQAEQKTKLTVIKPRTSPKKKTDNSIREITLRFFEQDRPLMERLEKSAAFYRRPISQEILFRLENGFKG